MQANRGGLGQFEQRNATGGHPTAVEVEGTPFRTQPMNRFPPPWRVVEMAGCFTVQDATGQSVAWFYFPDGPSVAPSAAVLLKEQARRRALNFAGPLLDKVDQLRRLVDHLEPTIAEQQSQGTKLP
jgi:hypothetical protein